MTSLHHQPVLACNCNWQTASHAPPPIPQPHILGRVGYGLTPSAPPANRVDISIPLQPSAKNANWQACWSSNQPLTQTSYKGILVRYNQEVLWGCFSMPIVLKYGCSHIIYKYYMRLFEVLARLHFPYLWRVWNFIPNITDLTATGTETYREFNQGRAQAYTEAHTQHILPLHALQLMPAATAIGCLGNTAHVYFIAARQAGRVIDNPLQIAPVHYPSTYGTHAPRFARARLTETHAGQAALPMLCISGTAGITGHRSMCPQDIIGQCRIMWRNINTLLGQVQRSPNHLYGIQVYVRHSHHVAAVKNYLSSVLPKNTPVAYFVADICRADLLVEMEAVA